MHDYRNYADPVHAHEVYEFDLENFELSRPVCNQCGEHIIDNSGYYLADEWYCAECVSRSQKYFD